MVKTTSQILQEGRARVAAGWCQWRNVSKDGRRHCAVGALGLVCPNLNPAMGALREALPAEWNCVQLYNDAPETTQADILALYDRALTAVTK